MNNKVVSESITFDDVLLIPSRSKVVPRDVDVTTKLTKNINLNIPIISSAMDTVTESRMAIAIAKEGGIGIIHKNFSIEQQSAEVRKVKRSESIIIKNPITLGPESNLKNAFDLMLEKNISGIPITKNGKLLGIITNRDLRFAENLSRKVTKFMTSKNLITAPEGISIEKAKHILHKNRIEKLLIVDDDFILKGLITVKDILKNIKFPNAAKDNRGQLLVGASVGVVGDFLERATELINAGTDVIVIDTAHGHSEKTISALKKIKSKVSQSRIYCRKCCYRRRNQRPHPRRS